MAKYAEHETVFDGGLNTKANLLDLPLHQSPSLQNIIFDDYGAIGSAKGYATLNSDPLGSFSVDGLASYHPSTMSAQLVAVCNGRAAVATGAATAFNDIASSVTVWTANTRMTMIQTRELLFFSNGNVKPYKFNGNEFTQMGVSAPSTVLTVQSQGAGNLDGSYQYVFTGVNSYNAEGDYGSASADFSVSSKDILVGSIPTAPVSSGIDHWNIFRNTAGASGAYWHVTCVTNGVTSFTDTYADSALTVAAPTDNGQPRFFKYMFHYQGRLWAAGDSNEDYLWFSEANQPEQFPSTNYIRVGRGDGLKISAIGVQNGIITISKSDFAGRTAIYLLFIGDPTTSSNPSNWYLTKADSDDGSESNDANITFENSLLMLNGSGIYAFQGRESVLNPSQTDKGGLFADAISFEIETDILNWEASLLKNASASIWKNKVWFAVPGSGASANSKIYLYDFVRMNSGNRKKGAWSVLSGPAISKFVVHENSLYGGSDASDGYIYQLDTGRNNGGSAIDSYFWTAPIRGKKGHYQNWKDFRWVYITLDTTGAWDLNFSYKVDSGAESSTETISMAASGSETTKTVKVPLAASGRYIQLKFAINTADQHFLIREFKLVYNLRGMRN